MLRNPRVLLVLAMSVLGSASLFCVFTYITPTLETITGVSPHGVTIVLLLFGVGITAGNFIGGALSDRNPNRFLVFSILAVFASLVALYFAEPFTAPMVAGLWPGERLLLRRELRSRRASSTRQRPRRILLPR